jgi:archaetidylinositol phosphate synthase
MGNKGNRLEVSSLPTHAIPSLGETKKSAPFKDATRVQESLTAPVERKALAWLASRLPSWVNSDHLTLLGFIAMFLAGASYALAPTNRAGLIFATLFLALNWFGDSLDGTLARMRNRQRPRYGFYVDHMIDTLGGLCLMGGLALSGYVDWRIALGMFLTFLMLSIEVYLAAYTLGTFRLSFGRFGPTEIRILLALGNIALWVDPTTRVVGSPYRLFDVGGIIAIAGMALMLVVSTICNTVKLYREEALR